MELILHGLLLVMFATYCVLLPELIAAFRASSYTFSALAVLFVGMTVVLK